MSHTQWLDEIVYWIGNIMEISVINEKNIKKLVKEVMLYISNNVNIWPTVF